MSLICNKQPQQPAPTDSTAHDIYVRVDAPIATGSAHLMRAGAELHLLLSDLELNDPRQAAVRVSCAAAAVKAALAEYDTSHRAAVELGFYALHDELLRTAGNGSFRIGEVLGEAGGTGLIDLDEKSVDAIARRYSAGGDEAAFTHFIAELREFSAELDTFDRATATADASVWREFPWKAITQFDRVRVYGQALAIINVLGTAAVTATADA
ncbi:hypothetical protein [Streptomyces sp. MST-110588]|uniref:hypothetical protein n=1 Tax=Streptomyces sp. MST-110588 TaxID=2833628 RepID=UPI001F5E1EAA|nr:hypothetical protein [Streptomyces sp. MST-110588]UNO38869.1 hypothetical protein KGS77_03425 [Streptomyces sp. MST-110588]